MGKTKQAKRKILEMLTTPRKEKKLMKLVLQSDPESLKEKHFQKALKKLERKGEIVKDGKLYRIVAKLSSGSDKSSEQTAEILLPIAEQLRRKAGQTTKKTVSFAEQKVDLDEEIRRLEKELEEGEEESHDSSDGIELDENSNEVPAVLSLSAFANDRIDALPKSCLPVPLGRKRVLKGINKDH